MTITATTDAAMEASHPMTSMQETARTPRAGRATRRSFSAEYKRRIVAEYDQAPSGEKCRELRR